MHEYMKAALAQAKAAMLCGEVPVGAVLVKDGVIAGSAHNNCKRSANPIEHAELILIDDTFKKNSGSYSLKGYELYVTLEPCPMCMGAMINAGLSKLVYGASDYNFGACGGCVNLGALPEASGMRIYGGILEKECSELIKEFFLKLRG